MEFFHILSILFFCLACNPGDGTLMKFETEMTCNSQKSWCAEIRFQEYDRMFTDYLTAVPKRCAYEPTMNVTTTTDYSEGDGWGEKYYEPYAYIWHDCTERSRTTSIKIYTEPILVADKTATRNVTVTLG